MYSNGNSFGGDGSTTLGATSDMGSTWGKGAQGGIYAWVLTAAPVPRPWDVYS